MDIMILINRPYIKYACIMLMSLKKHHQNINLNIYILHSDLRDEDFEKMDQIIGSKGINLIPVFIPEGTVDSFKIGNWPEVNALRLLVTDIFSGSLKRILHLDVDILITGNILEFYNTPFEDNYLIACEDCLTKEQTREKNIKFGRDENIKFFNAGVVLYNIEKMSEDGFYFSFYEECLSKYQNLKIEFPDQDMLNLIFGTKTLFADRMQYNYIPWFYQNNDKSHFFNTREQIEKKCCIVHMATGNSPWKGIHRMAINDMWWEYAKKTPFYLELKKEHLVSMCFIEKKVNQLNQIKLEHIGQCNIQIKQEEIIIQLEEMMYDLLEQEMEMAKVLDELC